MENRKRVSWSPSLREGRCGVIPISESNLTPLPNSCSQLFLANCRYTSKENISIEVLELIALETLYDLPLVVCHREGSELPHRAILTIL